MTTKEKKKLSQLNQIMSRMVVHYSQQSREHFERHLWMKLNLLELKKNVWSMFVSS